VVGQDSEEVRVEIGKDPRAANIRNGVNLQVFGVRVGDLHVRRVGC